VPPLIRRLGGVLPASVGRVLGALSRGTAYGIVQTHASSLQSSTAVTARCGLVVMRRQWDPGVQRAASAAQSVARDEGADPQVACLDLQCP
jgi:hypothetical protein